MAEPLKKIGKYEIQQTIGQGAMGVVYKARDPGIGREVAIKVIAGHLLSNPASYERFMSEARSAGHLSHPNVLTIHDLGEEEGVPFIVMEFLSGRDLRQIIDSREPLSIGKKLDIAAQIARGLHYAHRRQVFHRDIKPGNIRVLEDARVKIMDFGVAKFLGGDPKEITRTGAIVGTVHYMSPEQVQGHQVDHRSDIFSFGVVLYELLSYRKPFDGETITQVMYKIVHQDPAPLDVEGAQLLGELTAIVRKCLEKDAGDRFGDCGAIVRRLDAIREDLITNEDLFLGAEVSQLLEESDQLRRDGRYADATAALRRAQALSPAADDIEMRLEETRREEAVSSGIADGDRLAAAGQLEEAIARYRGVLRTNPDSAVARLSIQRTEKLLDETMRKKDVSERVGMLLKAGRDLLQVRQVKQAADCVQQILALDPGNAEAKKLEQECEEAAARSRHIAELLEEGRRQIAAQDFDAAIRTLNEVRKLDSSHFEAAELLREVERMREARHAFERAEQAMGLSDWTEAGRRLDEVRRFEPGFPGVAERLRRVETELEMAERLRGVQRLLRRQRPDEALIELKSMLTTLPDHRQAREMLARVESELAQEEAEAKGSVETSQMAGGPPLPTTSKEEPPSPKAASAGHAARPAPAPRHAAPEVAAAAKISPAEVRDAEVRGLRRFLPLVVGIAFVATAIAGGYWVQEWRRGARIETAGGGSEVTAETPAADAVAPGSAVPPPVPSVSNGEPSAEPTSPASQAPAPVGGTGANEEERARKRALAARDVMRSTRNRARAGDATRLAPTLYRKAEEAAERGEDALLAGEMEEALRAFVTSDKGFRVAADAATQAAKSQAELAEKEKAKGSQVPASASPAPAAPIQPQAPGSGEPDRQLAEEADRLRKEAESSRAGLDATYAGFSAARAVEEQANEALAGKRYADAVARFKESIDLYAQAQARRRAHETAVSSLLKSYEAAFEKEDLAALTRVTDLTDSDRRRWTEFFKIAREIDADVTASALTYEISGVRLKLLVKLSYQSGGEKKRVDTQFERWMRAAERDGRWVLEPA